MNIRDLLGGERISVKCRVEIVNRWDELFTEVDLPPGVIIRPGDEVEVHGEPVEVRYGDQTMIERQATIKRAGAIERTWTKLTGDLEFMELLEFSFSSGSRL